MIGSSPRVIGIVVVLLVTWRLVPPLDLDWDTAETVENTSYGVQRRRQAQDDHDGLIARIAGRGFGERG